MKEGRTIQSALQASHARFLKSRQDQSEADLHAGTFAKLVMAGKVRSALRFLTEHSSSGVLCLDDRAGPDST